MIGEVLRKMRGIYGYSASEMSKNIGISNSYLSEIENGKKEPSLELLEKYADIFGIKVSSLMLMSENVTSKDKWIELVKKMMTNLVNVLSSDSNELEK